MKNCASIPGLKLFLEETDYQVYEKQNCLQADNPQIPTSIFRQKKLADEFEYIEVQIDIEILLSNMDPLGWFPEIKNIKVLEGDDYSYLYGEVLIETMYFMKFLEECIENLHENRILNYIQNLFREMKSEYI